MILLACLGFGLAGTFHYAAYLLADKHPLFAGVLWVVGIVFAMATGAVIEENS